MITLISAGALAMLQIGPMLVPGDRAPESVQSTDVAYDSLAQGRAQTAIEQIETLLAEQPEDPALLINLGAAHMQAGDYLAAADALRRAEASDVRYELELADGRWMDSRLAARRALQRLPQGTLAIR